jgi:hypothetical protein
MNLLRTQGIIFILIVAVVVLASRFFAPFAAEHSLLILAMLILVLGVPHGALDRGGGFPRVLSCAGEGNPNGRQASHAPRPRVSHEGAPVSRAATRQGGFFSHARRVAQPQRDEASRGISALSWRML